MEEIIGRWIGLVVGLIAMVIALLKWQRDTSDRKQTRLDRCLEEKDRLERELARVERNYYRLLEEARGPSKGQAS